MPPFSALSSRECLRNVPNFYSNPARNCLRYIRNGIFFCRYRIFMSKDSIARFQLEPHTIQGARGIVARFVKWSPASAVSPIMIKFSQYSGVHFPARLKGPRQENQRAVIVKIIRAVYEGRWRIKNLKNKGYENCSTEHKLILTHFGENFKFF